MRIHLFNSKSGIIHGYNPHNLIADKDGTLNVGSKVIRVSSEKVMPFPAIPDSTYTASFVTDEGIAYDLGRITVHNGGILSSRSYTEREIDLRHALDAAEDKIEALEKKVAEFFIYSLMSFSKMGRLRWIRSLLTQ